MSLMARSVQLADPCASPSALSPDDSLSCSDQNGPRDRHGDNARVGSVIGLAGCGARAAPRRIRDLPTQGGPPSVFGAGVSIGRG
jgi:hypothetical protein